MLLAEELALVAIKPGKGRAQLGTGGNLNACLAGLLVAELLLDGAVGTADDDRIVAVPGGAPAEPVLAAAAQVVAERIDHALDGSDLASIGKVVRRLVKEAAAVAAGAG